MKSLYIGLFITLVFLSVNAFSQWSNNPAVNLAICDTSGEQEIGRAHV